MSEEEETSAPPEEGAAKAKNSNNSNDNNNNNRQQEAEESNNEKTMSEAQQNFENDQDPPPIYKFVMTGGPCGGKTTALARVFSFLRERGFEVITCPEAYTLLSSNGMTPHLFGTEGMPHFIQSAVFDTQMTLENSVHDVLKARGKPGVILCDRGSMDNVVYLGLPEFEEILQKRNITNVCHVRDNRYDAIFHLVTAADGALPYYTLENNAVRTETPELAIQVDRRTQKAWVGHPHMYVLDNSTDFEGKMNRLIDIICKIVGLPSNLKRRSAKFLLEPLPTTTTADMTALFPDDIPFQMFDVEKVYLQRNDDGRHQPEDVTHNYAFVRKRSVVDPQTGRVLGSVYQSTTVTRTSQGEMIEQKRIITHREYLTALLSRDTSRHIVQQRRISFLYQSQSFTIHLYQQPAKGLGILHAQVEAAAGTAATTTETNGGAGFDVNLPPFLPVVRLLQGTEEDEERYGAYSLSRMDTRRTNSTEQQQDLHQSAPNLSLATTAAADGTP